MNEAEFAQKLLDVIPPVVQLIRREVRSSAKGLLTVPQYRVLANIKLGMNTVSEIAENHGISQPAMTKIVNGLVSRGLVIRKKSSKDVRQTLLSLSAKGKSTYKKSLDGALKGIGASFHSLTTQERNSIIDGFVKLDAAISKAQ